MSSALPKIVDPLGILPRSKVFDPLGIGQSAQKQKAKEAVTKQQGAAPSAKAASEVISKQMEERKQELRQAAAAAGVTYIESDYDLLGRPKKQPKQRGASRTLLGD